MDWINVNDKVPAHMQKIDVYVENPFFGSFERTNPAVFLWFKGDDEGSFYDSEEPIHLDYITKWKPKPPE
jgi:hypothetical protein